jgi:microcystin-dependent protein
MTYAYIGEIRMWGGNFAPLGWAFCDGQLMSIANQSVLYSLIGTTYGGDGESTFALPHLGSRMPVGSGPRNPLGKSAGAETVVLTTANLPIHTHEVRASGTAATTADPGGHVWAAWGDGQYAAPGAVVGMDPAGVGPAGGPGFPHENRAPYLGLTFIIALEGDYPSFD